MSFPPSAAPKAAPKLPPAAKASPPKAKPSTGATTVSDKGPPISAAFNAPGAVQSAKPTGGPIPPVSGAPPIAAPTDVASALAHLTGKAIAQAILGGFASQIAQPK